MSRYYTAIMGALVEMIKDAKGGPNRLTDDELLELADVLEEEAEALRILVE